MRYDLQQGYKATAAFLRYYIHQNYVKPLAKSQSTSQESVDLSADDSDYSPCHAYSCDSNLEISDDEMVTSSSSKTSRSSTSPCKSTGSQVAHTQVDIHPVPDNYTSTDDEEVIVTLVDSSSEDTTLDLQSMTLTEQECAAAPSSMQETCTVDT